MGFVPNSLNSASKITFHQCMIVVVWHRGSYLSSWCLLCIMGMNDNTISYLELLQLLQQFQIKELIHRKNSDHWVIVKVWKTSVLFILYGSLSRLSQPLISIFGYPQTAFPQSPTRTTNTAVCSISACWWNRGGSECFVPHEGQRAFKADP